MRAPLDRMTLEHFRRLHAREKRERFERLFAAQLLALKLEPPVMQHRWALALGREWRSDFAWPAHRLLAEINGGLWRRNPKTRDFAGAHSHPTKIKQDWEKLNDAALLGYRVLQFTTDEVKNGKAASFVEQYFRRHAGPECLAASP